VAILKRASVGTTVTRRFLSPIAFDEVDFVRLRTMNIFTLTKFVVLFFCTTSIGVDAMPTKKDPLAAYRRRRNIKKSGEPAGLKVRSSTMPIFVIQKHAARSLHYDVRLSIDGVLVSWAVPKGPSVSTRVRRLAVRTDDHPIAYAKFEGVISKGQYGAGTVMVWDKGTYRNIKKKNGKLVSMDKCLKNGQIEVWLKGKKLQGGYAFVRMTDRKNQWLMIKMKDEHAHAKKNPVTTQKKSALTGRTMRQITTDAKK